MIWTCFCSHFFVAELPSNVRSPTTGVEIAFLDLLALLFPPLPFLVVVASSVEISISGAGTGMVSAYTRFGSPTTSSRVCKTISSWAGSGKGCSAIIGCTSTVSSLVSTVSIGISTGMDSTSTSWISTSEPITDAILSCFLFLRRWSFCLWIT